MNFTASATWLIPACHCVELNVKLTLYVFMCGQSDLFNHMVHYRSSNLILIEALCCLGSLLLTATPQMFITAARAAVILMDSNLLLRECPHMINALTD